MGTKRRGRPRSRRGDIDRVMEQENKRDWQDSEDTDKSRIGRCLKNGRQ